MFLDFDPFKKMVFCERSQLVCTGQTRVEHGLIIPKSYTGFACDGGT